MSQPHHHVFNALQRAINRSVPIHPLIPLLLEKGVIKKENEKIYDSKANGMKILTSYLRNQDFDTFLKFFECVCEVEEKNIEGFKKMELSIVESILSVVEDFDTKHPECSYAEKMEEIIKKWRKPALLSSPAQESADEMDEAGEMDQARQAELQMPTGLPYISDPVTVTFTSDKYHYYDSDLDFSISVPPGSIAKGRHVQLIIGACCYGPFAIPDRYTVVTDIFCVVASAQFSQDNPALVTMYHCLEMPVYQRHNSLFVLKADHKIVTKSGQFIFERLTNPDVSSDQPHLSFTIEDFCIFCGAVEQNSSAALSSELSSSRQSSFSESEPELVRTYSTDSDMGRSLPRTCSTESDTGASTEPCPQTSTPDSHRKSSTRKSQLEKPYRQVKVRERKTTPEYAIILYEPIDPALQSLKWPVLLFVCSYCPAAIKECTRQAEQHMKKYGFEEVEPTTMQVIIEKDIEFIPESEGTGWRIVAKKSPTVIKLSAVNESGRMRSTGKEKLMKMVEIQEYPERIKFDVSLDSKSMQMGGAHCKIMICGVERNDGSKHFFSIALPPDQLLRFRLTGRDSYPGKKESENSILSRIPMGSEKWLKYVVCPVYEPSCDPNKSPLVIFHAIDHEGSFKAVALFFHILSELGMSGIAEDLAFYATGSDTVPANSVLRSRLTESRLKKLQMVSLRLGLAKVFLTLEMTDTDGRLLGSLKAVLGDPTGEKSLCHLFKILEDGKRIGYDNYWLIAEALETLELEKQKEELMQFFFNTNPFLTLINRYSNPPQSHHDSSYPPPLQSPHSLQPVSPLSQSFMPSSMPQPRPQWSRYPNPADSTCKAAPSQLPSSAGRGYQQPATSLPPGDSYGSSHVSFSSGDSAQIIPGRHPLQIGGRGRVQSRVHGRGRANVRAPLLASHSDKVPHGNPPDSQYSTVYRQHWANMMDGTQGPPHSLTLSGSVEGGAPTQSPYSHHLLSGGATYQPSHVHAPISSSVLSSDSSLAENFPQPMSGPSYQSTLPPYLYSPHLLTAAYHPSFPLTAPYPSHQLTAPHPSLPHTVPYASFPLTTTCQPSAPHRLLYQQSNNPPLHYTPIPQPLPAVALSLPPLSVVDTQHLPPTQPAVVAATIGQSTSVLTSSEEGTAVAAPVSAPVSMVEPQQQQIADKLALSDPLTTSDQSSRSLPVVPPDGKSQATDVFGKEANTQSNEPFFLPAQDPSHQTQQQEQSHSSSQ